jgi:spoIIIJ-associated protein
MSSKILEIEEKTIDGAIEKACRDFGVPREKLNIEIISEGSSGFLGLMAKKAKIRASLLSFDMNFSMNSLPSGTELNENKPREKFISKPENRPDAKADIHPEKKPPRKQEAKPENRRRSEHPAPAAPRVLAVATSGEPAADKTIPSAAPVAATSPSALKARELLAGILSKMTFECQVTATETEDTIILGITGSESGLLIGRRGQNLDALQYILNKAVNRADTERKMIVVDSEEYRKRREESLLIMAQRIREKVKKTQKPLSLSHMNAHDRRIIHLALQEDEELITKSRGEGEYRKVIVLPAKRSNTGGHQKAKNRQ